MIIKDTLDRLTSYRNGLEQTLLDEISKDLTDWYMAKKENRTIIKNIDGFVQKNVLYIKIISEIQLTNSYIEYLSAWHLHYHGKSIPFDNSSLIKSVEVFMDQCLPVKEIRESLKRSYYHF